MRKITLSLLISLASITLLSAQPRLTITTDSRFYEPGSEVTVIVSGPPRAPLGLEVRGPKGELIMLKRLTLDSRGAARFTFLLDPQCSEGVYTVYAAVPGSLASVTFEVITRPSPVILLAPPGQIAVGKQAEILCFVYPGLQVPVTIYTRRVGEEWTSLGVYETNSSGWLVVPYTPPSDGVYEVKAEFTGTLEYGPASATASFKVVPNPPQWSIAAPPLKQLGETLRISCEGFDRVVALTVAGERIYKCGAGIPLDVPGPLFLYPANGNALGVPTVTMVKAKLYTTVRAPREVGLNEPFTIAALLTPPVPAVRVSFVDAQGIVLAEALSRTNGTALVQISLGKIGDHAIRAIPRTTSVFEVGECTPSTIRVLGEKIYVRITILDAAGRRLYNSLVEIAGELHEAPMGVAELALRAGDYDVKVHWRGLLVYTGRVRLEENNVTLIVPLYDLVITVVNFLGRPAAGELVELYRSGERIAAGVTGDDGRIVIVRVPPGIYTVKASGTERTVVVPQENEVRLVLPPSPLLPVLAALTAVAAAAIAISRRVHVKGGRVKRKPRNFITPPSSWLRQSGLLQSR